MKVLFFRSKFVPWWKLSQIANFQLSHQFADCAGNDGGVRTFSRLQASGVPWKSAGFPDNSTYLQEGEMSFFFGFKDVCRCLWPWYPCHSSSPTILQGWCHLFMDQPKKKAMTFGILKANWVANNPYSRLVLVIGVLLVLHQCINVHQPPPHVNVVNSSRWLHFIYGVPRYLHFQ